jgi:hypothetical protein
VIRCVRYQEDEFALNTTVWRGPVVESVWLTAGVVHLLVVHLLVKGAAADD